jgi:nitroreductase
MTLPIIGPRRAAGFDELAHSRRSWLGYTGARVSDEIITELVAVAGSAPSETNLQPWRFVAALGCDSIERLVPAFLPPNRPKLRDAGNVVVVYGDSSSIASNPVAAAFYRLGYTTPRDFAVRNAALAAMVFMLAGHARGLPTRPMVGFDPDALGALLGVPSEWVPVMSILIGYPSGAPVEAPTRVQPSDVLRFAT